jgi:hypothetical protein
MTQENFEKLHKYCPICDDNKNINVTTMGLLVEDKEKYFDNINATKCTKCGWIGKVSELTAGLTKLKGKVSELTKLKIETKDQFDEFIDEIIPQQLFHVLPTDIDDELGIRCDEWILLELLYHNPEALKFKSLKYFINTFIGK